MTIFLLKQWSDGEDWPVGYTTKEEVAKRWVDFSEGWKTYEELEEYTIKDVK